MKNNWRKVLAWQEGEDPSFEDALERRKVEDALFNEVLRQGLYESPNQDFSFMMSLPVKGRIIRKRTFPDGSIELEIDWYPDTEGFEAQKVFDNNLLLPLKQTLHLEGHYWKFAGSWTSKVGFPTALRHKGTVLYY